MKRRAAALCALTVLSMAISAAAAQARLRPRASPTRSVAVGDSAISGEAGRWAGNTNKSASRVDALGSSAYDDVPGRRVDPRLPPFEGGGDPHRRRCESANLACSGRAHLHAGLLQRLGRLQARARLLRRRRRADRARRRRSSSTRPRHRVRMVMVLISANNFGFADVVQTLRDRLADLAVVVEELLQRRLEHRAAVFTAASRPAARRRRRRVRERRARR